MKSINSQLNVVANYLIAIGLVAFLILCLPFINLYFFPSKVTSANSEFFISIPAISATAPIILNVDPWNETEYQLKLKNGVAHAINSAIPGETGTTFLFAHSSDWPWNITRYNTAFFSLSKLKVGDEIIITRDNKPINYLVADKKVVWPREVDVLISTTDKYQLILQTCTPLGTTFKRLLIFATIKS